MKDTSDPRPSQLAITYAELIRQIINSSSDWRSVFSRESEVLIDKAIRESTKELREAANKLVDYCEAHEWGLMPEPFDSINPLLKLLDRKLLGD